LSFQAKFTLIEEIPKPTITVWINYANA